MFCPNCKNPVTKDSRFCGECGCRLEPAAEEASAPEIVFDIPVEEKNDNNSVMDANMEEIVQTEAETESNMEKDNTFVDAPVEENEVSDHIIDEIVEEETEETDAMDAEVEDIPEEDTDRLARLEQTAKDGARKAGILAKRGAKKAGELASEGARKAGELASEGARKAGELASEGAEKAGIFAKKAGKRVGELTKEGAEKAETLIREGSEKVKKLPLNGKILLMAVAALVVLAAGIGVLCSVFGGTDSYRLYLKEQEIFCTDSGGKHMEVTRRLLGDVDADNSDLAEGSYFLSAFTALCEDRLFYPDRLSGDDEGFNIYYRDLNRKKEEQQLASGVISYAVSDTGKEALYLRGSEGKLYRYDLKEREKLASGVTYFEVTEDLKQILYLTEDMDLYTMDHRNQKEKLASDVDELVYVSQDLQTVYYLKDGNLYIQRVGQDRLKLDTHVESVIYVWQDGRMYYTTGEEVEVKLWDYVTDDMTQEDRVITQPEEPVYPDAPSRPYSWEYETTDAYNKAKERYDAAYAEYESLCRSIEENYEAACQAYREKENRDVLRQELKEETQAYNVYGLHYYDGKRSVEVLDNLDSAWAEDYAADTPAVVVRTYGDMSRVKVKLSRLDSSWELAEAVKEAREEGGSLYAVSGNSAVAADSEMDIRGIYVSDDGKKVAMAAEEDGALYTAKVQPGRALEPKLLDEDVYPGFITWLPDGKLAYFKDMDRSAENGDLYIDGALADIDVYCYSLNYSEILDAVMYYTDYSGQMGTLKLYKGKTPEKVADDVYSYRVSEDGEIYYLYDYSDRSHTGDLYRYAGGKTKWIDEDVAALMDTPCKPGQVCGVGSLG